MDLDEQLIQVEAKTNLQLSIGDIISNLIKKNDHELLFTIISELEETSDSWELAERCYRHFKNLKSKYETECNADSDFHDWDSLKKEVEKEEDSAFLYDYRMICEAGFTGSIEDYRVYLKTYGRERKCY